MLFNSLLLVKILLDVTKRSRALTHRPQMLPAASGPEDQSLRRTLSYFRVISRLQNTLKCHFFFKKKQHRHDRGMERKGSHHHTNGNSETLRV